MRIFLGGVNGAGKTTLLHSLKEARLEFEIVRASHELMRFLGIEGDYEALRAMDQPYKREKLAEMIRELFAKYENLILDSHYLNLIRGVVTKTTGPWIQNFDALVLLKVSAETVLERTSQEDRDRALFPPGISKDEEFSILRDYIEQYNAEFESLCSTCNVPGKIIDGDRSPQEVLDEALEYIGSF